MEGDIGPVEVGSGARFCTGLRSGWMVAGGNEGWHLAVVAVAVSQPLRSSSSGSEERDDGTPGTNNNNESRERPGHIWPTALSRN